MNYDEELLKREQELESENEATRKSNMLKGIGNALASAQGFGNFYLGRMNTPVRNELDRVSSKDELKQKAYEYLKQKREMAKDQREQNYTDALGDDLSPQAKAYKASLIAAGLPSDVVRNSSAADLMQQGYSPSKLMEIKAKSQVDFENQKALKAIEQAGDMRKLGLQQKLQEAKEAREQALKSRPDPKKAKEFDDRYNNIQNELGRLDKLIDDHGTYEMVGPHNANLDQSITSVALDAAKLFDPESVARETEVAAQKKMLFEPGTLTTRNKTAKAIIANYKKILEDRAKVVRGERFGDTAQAPKASPQELAMQELLRRKAAKQTAGR